MKNRRRTAKRVLTLLLTAAMVLSATPTGPLAVYAEDAGSGLCAHHAGHAAECGYIAARAEVPCDRDCTDTDGDGVIDHGEDCAYTPAVEGQPCAYECRICPVQELIDALPEAGDITAENAEEVAEQLDAISKQWAELTDEETEQVDTVRYAEAIAAMDALAGIPEASVPEENDVGSAGNFTVTGGVQDKDYTYKDGVLTILTDTPLTIANTDISKPTTDRIWVNSGVSADITLAGVNIDVSSAANSAALEIDSESSGQVTVTLADGTENILKSGENRAGLQKGGTSSSLILQGNGSLTAVGGTFGAGIGSGWNSANDLSRNSGNITIHSGTITAIGCGGAGIGGSLIGKGSNITITGGTVTAIANGENNEYGGAGIGGGSGGSGIDITITGGTVTATGAYGAGIGGGRDDTSGTNNTITISGGVVTATSLYFAGVGGAVSTFNTGENGSAFLVASSITDHDDTSDWSGVIFQNNEGRVYGNVTLSAGNYPVPEGSTLTIPYGASLSGNGTLTGTGTFLTENMTEDMITIPEGIGYTGTDLSDDIKEKLSPGGTVICGQTFTASGWTPSVKKQDDSHYIITYTYDRDSRISLSKTVTISSCPLTEDNVTLDAAGCIYDGTAQTPAVIVNGVKLKEGTDYTVSYSNNVKAGSNTATATITGQGYYTGTVTKAFTIVPRELTVQSAVGVDRTYKKDNVTVDVTVVFDGVVAGDSLAYTAAGVMDNDAVGNNKSVFVTVTLNDPNYTLKNNTTTATVNITYAASVETAEGTTYYGTIEDAWTAAKGNPNGATITLLSEVSTSNTGLTVAEGDNITLESEQGKNHTLDLGKGELTVSGGRFTLASGKLNSGNSCIALQSGSVSIEGGSVSGYNGVYVTGGSLDVRGGSLAGNNQYGSGICMYDGSVCVYDGATVTGGYGILVNQTSPEDSSLKVFGGSFTGSAASLYNESYSCNVALSGGTFNKGDWCIFCPSELAVSNLLAAGYAYRWSNGGWIGNDSVQRSYLQGIVTVGMAPIQSMTATTNKTSLTYGDTAPTLTAEVKLAENVSEVNVTYQWYQDSTEIAGATSAAYTPGKLNAGEYVYTCTATADGYSLTSEAVTVKVERKAVTAVVTAQNKTYDGNTNAVVEAKVNEDLVNGDSITITGLTGTFEDANVGTNKVVRVNSVNAAFIGADNYEVSIPAATTAAISPQSVRDPVITLEPASYEYDGTAKEPTVTVMDGNMVINPEEYTVQYSNNVEIGTAIVTITDAEGGNYEVSGSATFQITKRAISVTPDSLTKEYGTGDPTLTYEITRGSLLDGHTLTLERVAGDTIGSYAINRYTITDANDKDVAGIYDVTLANVDFQITKPDLATATVTLALPEDGYTYDGTAKEPAVTVVKNGNTLVQGTDYTVTYSNNTNATNDGDAIVTIMAVEYGNYDGSQTVEFKINSASISDAAVTLANSLTYSGREQIQDVTVTVGDVKLTEGKDYTVSGNTGTNAGDYTLTVSGTGNYAGGVEKTFSIAKADAMVYIVKLTPRTYEQGNREVEAEVGFTSADAPNTAGIRHTVTAQMADDTAGERKPVTVTITVSDPNYRLVDRDGTPIDTWQEPNYSVTITKAKAPAAQEVSREYIRDESATGTIDLGALLPVDRGETSYTLEFRGVDPSAATARVDGDTLTHTTREKQASTFASIEVTAVMQNYEDARIVVDIFLRDGLAVSGLPGSVTYGDAPFTLAASGGLGDAAVTWESSDASVATVDGNGQVTVTGAGTVTITATKAGGANYGADAVAPVTFTVAKKAVTVSGIAAEDKVYDGATDAALNYAGAAFDGIVAGDSLTVTATGAFANADAGQGKTVALTGLTLGGTDAGNYVMAEGGQQTQTTAAILSKDITVNITPNGGVYAGQITPAAAALTGVVDGDTVPVTLTYTGTANDGTTTYNGADVPTEAGSYTVTASIANGNYTLTGPVTADFVVARADAELSVSPVSNKVYGDPAFALTPTHKGDGAVTYASSNEDVATVDGDGTVTLHNAGEAAITVTLARTANYEGDEISVAIRVEKAGDQLTVEKLTYEVTYGDADFLIAPTTDSGSTVTFTSSDTSVATVDETGKVHIAGAGEAQITLETAESGNYNAVSQTVTVTVKPKEITVTADALTRTYGEDDPELTWTPEGLVGGDVLTDITVTRKDGQDAGNYTITANQKTGANPNYEIRFVDGALTILPKDITGAAVELGAALIENGETQTQEIRSVTVQNSKGEAMDVTYEVTGNTGKDWGTYTMTITGIGNFTGAIQKTYVIAPAADSVVEPNPDGNVAIGTGSIGLTVQHETGAPTVTLRTGKAEIIELLVAGGGLTAEELSQAADGADIDIILKVTDISGSIGAESKAQIGRAASGYTIGRYIDISLYKQMTQDGQTGRPVQITGTYGSIAISLKVPEDLLNTDSAVTRTFWIIRNHEGQVEFLPMTFDEQTGMLTFETDKFSDYAIVYQDTKRATDSGSGSTDKGNESSGPLNTATGGAPQTGDESNWWLWLALMLASCAGAAGIMIYRRKKREE